jgi:hypothetical protein
MESHVYASRPKVVPRKGIGNRNAIPKKIAPIKQMLEYRTVASEHGLLVTAMPGVLRLRRCN